MLGFTSISETPISVANALVVVSKVHSTNLLKYLYLSLAQTANSNLIAAIPKTQETSTLNSSSFRDNQSTDFLLKKFGAAAHSIDALNIGRILQLSGIDLLKKSSIYYQQDLQALVIAGGLSSQYVISRLKSTNVTAQAIDSLKYQVFTQSQSTAAGIKAGFLDSQSINTNLIKDTSAIFKSDMLRLIIRQVISSVSSNKIGDFRVSFGASAFIRNNFVVSSSLISLLKRAQTRTSLVDIFKIALKSTSHLVNMNRIGGGDRFSSSTSELYASKSDAQYIGANLIRESLAQHWTVLLNKKSVSESQESDSLLYFIGEMNTSLVAHLKGQYKPSHSASGKCIASFIRIISADTTTKGTISNSHESDSLRMSSSLMSFGSLTFKKYAYTRRYSNNANKIDSTNPKFKVAARLFGNYYRSSGTSSNLKKDSSLALSTSCYRVYEEPTGYFEESVFGDSYWVVAFG